MKQRAVLMAVALAIGLLSGCSASAEGEGADQIASAGGSGNADQQSGSSGSSGGEAPAKDMEERQLQFTNCLRDNGVDIPDASGGKMQLKVDSEAERKDMEEAMDACRQYAPGGEEGFQMSEEQKQEMADYIDCLQEEGVEIGDPDPETGRPSEGAELLMEPDSDTEAAMSACEDKRPDRMMVTK